MIPSFCYLQNGGWIVIQQRVDGSVNFTRNWNDYVSGFGTPDGNFWIGLENMHKLTSSKPMELLVDLYTFDGQNAYAKYDMFAIGNSSTKYILSLGSFTGTTGNSLSSHRNFPFTTYDVDNDIHNRLNCGDYFSSGWWFSKCFSVNLNGVYHNQKDTAYAKGIHWYSFKGHYISMKRVVMKIRQKSE